MGATEYIHYMLGAAVLLPLLSFFLILIAGPKMGKAGVGAGYVAMVSIFGSAALSFAALFFMWLPAHREALEKHDPHLPPHDDHHSVVVRSQGSDEHSPDEHSPDEHSSDEHSDAVHEHEDDGHAGHGDSSHGVGDQSEAHGHADGHADDHGEPYQEKPNVFVSGVYYTLGKFGNLRLEISYYIDSLTVTMFCMVTLIASMIHLYATGYMHDELEDYTDHDVTLSDGSALTRPGRYSRFFQSLSLFCFSMLGLVLAGNIAMVFVFWELVGICSYFLIGFYIERKSASTAANKAFIVNRVGDFGMIIGLMALWGSLGTFAFGDAQQTTEISDLSLAAYEDQLDNGELPTELRTHLAQHDVVLPRHAAVVRQPEGTSWAISGFLSRDASAILSVEGDHVSVESHLPGIFSQVRPDGEHHPDGEGSAYDLVTPDGMVHSSIDGMIVDRVVADHSVMFTDVKMANQASASEIGSQTRQARAAGFGYWLLIVAGVGIFCGCVGKSAQFPLHVWLPDAMEGPTPVSALVHSATMVAAGVYLVGRFFPVFAPEVLLVIASAGCITLFMAATIAITATDIKRVLAYSTVSQLGYMMLALGIGGWIAGMMHLITHAFFKSLLFMCSGSVIHAVHTNEMPEMGGLWKKMPVTAFTMLIGCLAIAGISIPFVVGFSGYYSKDMILEQAASFMGHNHSMLGSVFFVAASGGAAITAFYMFRMWFLTFVGTPRNQHRYEHAHESPKAMYIPLVVISVFAVVVAWSERVELVIGAMVAIAISLFVFWKFRQPAEPGLDHENDHGSHGNLICLPLVLSVLVFVVGITWFSAGNENVVLSSLLRQARPDGALNAMEGKLVDLTWPAEPYAHDYKTPVTILATLTAWFGLGLATVMYALGWLSPSDVRKGFEPIYNFLLNKWWFDELYELIWIRPTHAISRVISACDKHGLDALVDGSARVTKWIANMWDSLVDRRLLDGSIGWVASVTYAIGLFLRRFQTGKLRHYVVFIVMGTIIVFVLVSLTRSLLAM